MKNGLLGKGLFNSTFSLEPLVDHLRQLHLKSIGPAANELGDVLETVDRHQEIL